MRALVPVREGSDRPSPPKHLSVASRRLWREIVADYDLPPHALALLTAALEAKGRMDEARATVARDGAYVAGRFGLRAHPALAVERDSRIAFARLIREVGLDLVDPAERRMPSRYR
jgi:phage terminase small subunit